MIKEFVTFVKKKKQKKTDIEFKSNLNRRSGTACHNSDDQKKNI